MPVNAVIIIALAIFVLLMMAAFFGGAGKQIDKSALQTTLNEACYSLSAIYDCDPNKVGDAKATYNNNQFSLMDICRQVSSNPIISNPDCVKLCSVCRRTVAGEGSICADGADGDAYCERMIGSGAKCSNGHCCPSGKTWNEADTSASPPLSAGCR